MLIGVPKEIKNQEHRVGLVPGSVRELLSHGHDVIVESNAGIGIGMSNTHYQEAGATIANSAEEVFAKAEMIIKVKEPQPNEYELLKKDQILFTYLHLAAEPKLTKALMSKECVAIAYETVTGRYGGLPLLSPMSEVAGRLSIQAGSRCLEKQQGGLGVLLGGVPGVAPGNVVVIGGGVVGTNAVRMAMGKEAHVTVLDTSLKRLQELDLQFGAKLNTIFATRDSIEEYVLQADLVVGAVLIPGAAAPRLVTTDMVSAMRDGAVIIDVAIDQGGCMETSRPTTHEEPTYVVDGVVHYCVTNMPGAVPRTSSFALNNATLPFAMAIANKGYKQAMADDAHLLNGLNVYKGALTYKAVARDLNLEYVQPSQALGL